MFVYQRVHFSLAFMGFVQVFPSTYSKKKTDMEPQKFGNSTGTLIFQFFQTQLWGFQVSLQQGNTRKVR